MDDIMKQIKLLVYPFYGILGVFYLIAAGSWGWVLVSEYDVEISNVLRMGLLTFFMIIHGILLGMFIMKMIDNRKDSSND